jgi:hypothetical protein
MRLAIATAGRVRSQNFPPRYCEHMGARTAALHPEKSNPAEALGQGGAVSLFNLIRGSIGSTTSSKRNHQLQEEPINGSNTAVFRKSPDLNDGEG